MDLRDDELRRVALLVSLHRDDVRVAWFRYGDGTYDDVAYWENLSSRFEVELARLDRQANRNNPL